MIGRVSIGEQNGISVRLMIQMKSIADDGETYVFKFDTAWSPPIPVYDEMIKQGFNLVAKYVEYGMGYHGEYSIDGDFYHNEIQDGDEIDEHLQSEYA